MLQIQNLTYRIEGRLLFENASAAVPPGHKVGFVGRNGSGKSTLLRIILGELAPESGAVSVPPRWRVGAVAQEAPGGRTSLLDTVLAADHERAALLAEAETARDPGRIADIQTRLADIGAHAAPAKAAAILAGLGFPEADQKRPCSDFSGGWRMRVALASVLFTEPDLLLLDEPTNYLDLEGVIWLENYLKTYPYTVIIVSHDRSLLNSSVDSILHLEDRRLRLYGGNYDTFEETRRQHLEHLMAQRKKQEAQRRHMQAFVDRFRYKASKARQAQSRLKAIARMKPIAAMMEERILPFDFPDPEPLSPPIITMENAEAGYEPGKPVLRDLNLRIDNDDRIALLGANGNGKSTFARLLSGRLALSAGRLRRSPTLSAGYFAQHQLDELNPQASVYDHFEPLVPDPTQAKVRALAGRYGFALDKADRKAGDLSGGEKARLLLALATHCAPHMLILDEPTNHLDVDSREALVHALNEYQGAVILISHDWHLIETCAERLWLVAEGTVTPFDGDLADYRTLLLSERTGRNLQKKRAPGASKQESRREAAQRRAELAPLKQRAQALERQAAALTARIAKLDAALADAALYRDDPAKAAALSRERAEARRALETAEAAWLEAAEAYETAQAGAET